MARRAKGSCQPLVRPDGAAPTRATEFIPIYREVASELQKLGVGICYHFCSEIEDTIYIQNTYGVRPAEWSRDHHALGPNVC